MVVASRVRLTVALTLLVPILWLGGATPSGSLCALALACGAWAILVDAEPLRGGARVGQIVLYSFVAVALLQLTPMPRRLQSAVSPRTAAIWTLAEGASNHASSWRSLSLDPPATASALVIALTSVAGFSAAAYGSRSRVGRRQVVDALAFATLSACVVALLHGVVGAEKLYGLYTPQHVDLHNGFVKGPLLNANHLAACAGVAAPLLVGIALEGTSPPVTFGALGGATVAGAIALLSLSRGGIGVLVVESAAIAVYVVGRIPASPGRRLRSAAIALVAVLGPLAVGGLVAADAIRISLADTDYSKLQLSRAAAGLASDFRWFGVGRGAFGSVFPAYESVAPNASGAQVRFTHPESWPMQLLTECGLPFFGFVVLGFGLAVWLSRRVWSAGPRMVCASIALAGLLIHDLVDFSMELPGMALVAATLFAAVVTPKSSDRARKASGIGGRFGPLLVAAIGLASWFSALGRQADDDASRIEASWRSGQLESASVQAALLRHPADPLLWLAAGVARLSYPDGGSLLTYAVRRGPHRATTHLFLARWLALHERKPQAWGEYRLAVALMPAIAPTVVEDMARLGAPIAEVVSLANTLPIGETVSVTLTAGGKDKLADAVDAELISRFSPAIDAAKRRFRRAVLEGRKVEAQAIAEELARQAPTSPHPYLMRSALAGPGVDGEAHLAKGLTVLGADPDLLVQLVVLKGSRLGEDAVSKEVETLRGVLAQQGASVRLTAALAEVAIARQQFALGIARYLEAASAAADPTPYLERAAVLAESQAKFGIALSCWQRLHDAHPHVLSYGEAVDRVKSKAAGSGGLPE